MEEAFKAIAHVAEGQQAQLQLLHAELVEIRNSSQKHEVLHKLQRTILKLFCVPMSVLLPG